MWAPVLLSMPKYGLLTTLIYASVVFLVHALFTGGRRTRNPAAITALLVNESIAHMENVQIGNYAMSLIDLLSFYSSK